ncbi:1-phosphofructokinase family hexose kinase [Schumannella sp. 10F1B-5-1]|uniref:1-phosphofructokinase family hexose kinase n=1 Tax=Schumannella sp. 10F1B-5-1 TaxID=2590780 RepID=UPI001131C54E|nr:1-phosphofructokinase family hexose kinase [Schumannella sp. 10F1B-5-1]TPW71006.1 1-phosphofructokinase family hexose kinase [Schumannella sp. 10F1B-5-1]
MIVTLTLNPSLDRTVTLDRLVPGAVLRTSEPVLEPGGKGVNVTRALTANGHPSIAVVPVAGAEGSELGRLLDAAEVDGRYVAVSGRTRSNLSIVGDDGTVTKLNEPGSPLDADDLLAIATTLRGTVRPGDWLVVSGSVTPGLIADDLRALIEAAGAGGAQVAVDTSGEALAAAVSAAPRILKPNRDELAELVGRPLHTIAHVLDAARQVRDGGVGIVLVTLGAAGAVLVADDVELVGESPVARPVSPVGAGDCLLAGFLSRYGADGAFSAGASVESDLADAFTTGLTWGAAAAGLPGSAVPSPGDLHPENVQLVWQPDLDRPLVAG